MIEFLRRLPHPGYKHYGGAKNRCRAQESSCPIPRDKMDRLFRKHDLALRASELIEDELKRKKARLRADKALGVGLRTYLKPYADPIWGPIYRRMAMLIFKP